MRPLLALLTIGGLVMAASCVGVTAGLAAEPDAGLLPSCDGKQATIVAASEGGSLVGTEGDDVVVGSENADQIDGMGGNDVICGLAGNDVILGGDGDDRIFAGADYEYPEGGFLGDDVAPGPGDDLVDLGTDPRLSPGEGMDTLSYLTSASGITVRLAPVGQTFTVTGEGTDTVTTHTPFQLWGSNLADLITGSDGDDHIRPLGGDDVVDALGGDDDVEDGCPFRGCQAADHDVLLGGKGSDVLASGVGRDDLDGGPGDDTVTTTSRRGVGTMDGGAGDDDLRVFVRGSDTHGNVDGGAGADVLDVFAYNLNEGGRRVVVDAADGRLGADRLGSLLMFTGVEAYHLDPYNTGTGRQPLVFRFLGSAASERVTVSRSRPSVLHAAMRGGDDVVRATNRDDVIDGGTGYDMVRAFQGDDVCRSVEVGRGCER
jgi:Ca2+-binding RTX toxin-like protein